MSTCIDCRLDRTDLGPAGNCPGCQHKRWEAHLELCRSVLEAQYGTRPSSGSWRRRIWDLASAAIIFHATYRRPFFGLVPPTHVSPGPGAVRGTSGSN